MSNNAGAGGGPAVPHAPGPVAAEPPLAPPVPYVPILVPDDPVFLRSISSAIRNNKYLRKLSSFVSPQRRRSSARFVTDLAAVTSIITTIACDILFLSFSKQ